MVVQGVMLIITVWHVIQEHSCIFIDSVTSGWVVCCALWMLLVMRPNLLQKAFHITVWHVRVFDQGLCSVKFCWLH